MNRRGACTLALALACVTAGGVTCAKPAAEAGPGFIPLVTNKDKLFAIPPMGKPAYRVPVRDPVFGTTLTRIANDPGASTSPVHGKWGPDARHVYSKQQPWNATGTLMTIENRGAGASPSPLLLDGETYAPHAAPCPDYPAWDYRWHPSREHANEQINVDAAGTELMWFDVTTCTKTRSWPLPFAAHYGIGSGEGNVSADGRYVVVSDDTRMVVVDMDPQPPHERYPSRRFGPIFTFPPCSLSVAAPTACPLGNVSISPSGRYIDVKYAAVPGAECDSLCDMHRIFEVDADLVIRPHVMAGSALRCGSFAARPNGWIFPLKHADMALDPFDHDEDVLIGGRACPGSNLGQVVKVRLRDGAVTSLTSPGHEAGYSHGSARAVERPGWFYVTYSCDPAYAHSRCFGEVVAVKLDGSHAVERLAHYRSSASTYRAQAHAVPSPDGRRILFTSDWGESAGHAHATRALDQDYVIDARSPGGADTLTRTHRTEPH